MGQNSLPCYNRKGDIFLPARHIRWSAERTNWSQVSGDSTWIPQFLTSLPPQVSPSQLVLFCNGKLLQGEDEKTLRQARVCSGSKILASRLLVLSMDLIFGHF